MSATLINNGQRAIVTSSFKDFPRIITIEISRRDRTGRPRFVNVRVEMVDALIELLQAERDTLLARNAGGDDA